MPYDLTRDGLISALAPTRRHYTAFVLGDVLRAKRERGDLDAERFRLIARHEFAYGLNASVEGARNAMVQWIAKADRLGWSERKVAECEAFVADLDEALANVRVAEQVEAA